MTRRQGFAFGVLVGLSSAALLLAAIYLIDTYAH
jgi:hypothetical protein